jgi:hypothetical protein
MMTVKELIRELKKFSSDLEVKATWESVIVELNPDNFYVSKDGILLIDADGNSYKEKYTSGIMKAKR